MVYASPYYHNPLHKYTVTQNREKKHSHENYARGNILDDFNLEVILLSNEINHIFNNGINYFGNKKHDNRDPQDKHLQIGYLKIKSQ
jgi:hypothetical protein